MNIGLFYFSLLMSLKKSEIKLTEGTSLLLWMKLENPSTLSFQWIQWEAHLSSRITDYTAPRDFVVCWWLWVSCCRLEVSLPGEPPVWSAGWISLKFSVLIFEELQ